MNVDEGYPPDYEIAAWKNFDLAVCGFCIEQTRQTRDASPIISTLVGEGVQISHRVLLSLHLDLFIFSFSYLLCRLGMVWRPWNTFYGQQIDRK